MGMFDSVYAACPRCGTKVEFQTKAGECCMDTYTVDNAPTELLLDIMNEPNWCRGCQSWFALIDETRPPGPPPRPNLLPRGVREPTEGEFTSYSHDPSRLRWWVAPFGFADLASADTLPKGQDAKQGLAGTESGAVDAEGSETPNV